MTKEFKPVYHPVPKEFRADVPEGAAGDWRVEHFRITEEEARFAAVRSLISASGQIGCHSPGPGRYTRLVYRGDVVMSDTIQEYLTNWVAIHRAEGHVLIAGLGLGCVLQAIAKKSSVKSVTVVEQAPEVIELVWEHLRSRQWARKVELVQGSIFDVKLTDSYDYGWFDIWNNYSSANLPQMTRLRRRYGKICKAMGFWGELECQRAKRLGW